MQFTFYSIHAPFNKANQEIHKIKSLKIKPETFITSSREEKWKSAEAAMRL